MATKKPLKKPVSKRTRRFDDGGYTGDDPIVKYRMGQLSAADTYDAMGQKDLADASRAKEPTEAPSAPKTSPYEADESKLQEIINKPETKTAPAVRTVTKKSTTVSGPTAAQREMLRQRDDVNDGVEPTKPAKTNKKKFNAIESSENDAKAFQKTMEAPSAKPKAAFGTKEAGKEMKEDEDRAIASVKNYVKNATLGSVAKDAAGLLPYGRGAKLLGRGAKEAQLLLENSGKGKKLLEYAKDAVDRAKQSGGMKGEFRSQEMRPDFKKGGKVKPFKQGGSVRSTASTRGDGIATKGHTRGKCR
jgi:hypothetical protein